MPHFLEIDERVNDRRLELRQMVEKSEQASHMDVRRGGCLAVQGWRWRWDRPDNNVVSLHMLCHASQHTTGSNDGGIGWCVHGTHGQSSCTQRVRLNTTRYV